MAGEKRKKVRFDSWVYEDREIEARALIQKMLDMGSPIVDQGGVMSLLKYDELGIRAQPMSKDNLLAEIHRTTEYRVQKWVKQFDHNGNQIFEDGKPKQIMGVYIGDVHHRLLNCIYGLQWPHNGLWKLRGVLSHPIINKRGQYVLRNGLSWSERDVNGVMVNIPQIHVADGYDPMSQYFFAVPERVRKELEGIENQKPTEAEVEAALECIDEFLCDFTFATGSARASAIAFMLTMLCREIIEGSVPMLEVRAAESQSGKSLLVKMMIEAVTGEDPSPLSPNFRETSEFEKELLSQLMKGKNYIFMDDVTTKVQSSFLNMALTSRYVDKRLLGMNTIATVYSGMPFVLTANNPAMSDDIKNRVYLLDILKPEEGKKFTHTKPETYAKEIGPKILRALFTLYNNWVKNEECKPFTAKRIDGFIEWSVTIGGILQAAGIKGFLDDTMKQIKEVDQKLEQAADMAKAWYEAHKSDWKRVKDILAFMVQAGYVKADDPEQSKLQNAANKLKALRMVKLPGGYHFERDEGDNRGSVWRVVKDGSGS